jgi:hypothetical protein
METVGEMLDTLKFSVRMLFVEDCVVASGVTLLNEIFQLLPVPWNQDPVKVRAKELALILIKFFLTTSRWRVVIDGWMNAQTHPLVHVRLYKQIFPFDFIR